MKDNHLTPKLQGTVYFQGCHLSDKDLDLEFLCNEKIDETYVMRKYYNPHFRKDMKGKQRKEIYVHIISRKETFLQSLL